MLPLPQFELSRPGSLDEAIALLAADPEGTMLIAGGTDVVPALKLGLRNPRRLVSLQRVDGLRGTTFHDDGSVTIGAGVKLAAIAADARLRQTHPAFVAAASLAASPQIRNSATLGGNICLATRCTWYNQSPSWRTALGNCLRLEGDKCRVVPSGKRCVAAFSSDTPAPLIAYGAQVRLVSGSGTRTVAVERLFAADGACHVSLGKDEVLVDVTLPAANGLRAAYRKLTRRGSIDFPLLSVAAAVRLAEDGTAETLRVVVGALAAQPRVLSLLSSTWRNRPFDRTFMEDVAREAEHQCRPLTNIDVDPEWRREMVAVYVRRALQALAP